MLADFETVSHMTFLLMTHILTKKSKTVSLSEIGFCPFVYLDDY